jgi:hypothetical protein
VSDTLLPECLILLRVVLPFSGANNTPSSPPTARPNPNDTQIPLLFIFFIFKGEKFNCLTKLLKGQSDSRRQNFRPKEKEKSCRLFSFFFFSLIHVDAK